MVAIARGKFITLEGGEGAGKSTQAARLAAWLGEQNHRILVTREPGGSPAAEAIRELLLGGRAAPFGPLAEAVLFAVARADHLETAIRPALADGRWVISDRFMDSTLAYQGSNGADPAELARLEEIAVGGTRPDLTLILDLPAELGLRRARARTSGADRFEADALRLHEERRRTFLAIAAREPERCVVIDASVDEDAVATAIRAAVAERLGPLPQQRG